MRFLGKYELLEQHTVGTVETFSAHPIGGSELYLVHLFSLPALTKASPSNQDLLDYLERFCPPALGSVLDGGQYDDGSEAYIVTRFPRDPNALGQWVTAYKAMPKAAPKVVPRPDSESRRDVGGRDVGDGPVRDLWQDRVPSAPQPQFISEKPAGDFTRAFQAFGTDEVSQKSPKVEEDWERPVAPVSRPVSERPVFNSEHSSRPESRPHIPGSLTEQLAGLGEGAQLPTSRLPVEPPAGQRNNVPRASAPRTNLAKTILPKTLVPRNGEPVQGREADFWDLPDPAPPPVDSPKEEARSGEFTQFFRSPFAAPPPPDPLPSPMPDLANHPPPARSDFTQLFGSSSGGNLTPLAPEPLLEPPGQSERGNFTEIFGSARPAPSAPAVPQWTPEKPADPHEKPDRAGDYFISNTNSLPISPGRRDGEPVFRSGAPLNGPTFGAKQEEGATRVFKAPAHEEAPAPPPIPEGESQYTRIIKGAKREPASAPANAGTPDAPPAGGFAGGMKFPLPLPKISVAPPVVSMPTIGPSGIGAPQVRMPSAAVSAAPPVLPQLHVPPVSASALPKLPPSAKVPAIRKPGNWTSFAPLIIILNLIFLAAVGLVLYFVFKP